MGLGKWKWYDFMGTVPALAGSLLSKNERKNWMQHTGRGLLSGAAITGAALGGPAVISSLGGGAATVSGAGAAGLGSSAASAESAAGGAGTLAKIGLGAKKIAPFLQQGMGMMNSMQGQQQQQQMPMMMGSAPYAPFIASLNPAGQRPFAPTRRPDPRMEYM